LDHLWQFQAESCRANLIIDHDVSFFESQFLHSARLKGDSYGDLNGVHIDDEPQLSLLVNLRLGGFVGDQRNGLLPGAELQEGVGVYEGDRLATAHSQSFVSQIDRRSDLLKLLLVAEDLVSDLLFSQRELEGILVGKGLSDSSDVARFDRARGNDNGRSSRNSRSSRNRRNSWSHYHNGGWCRRSIDLDSYCVFLKRRLRYTVVIVRLQY